MIKQDKLTFGRFLTLSDVMTNLDDVTSKLMEQPCPKKICGKDVPQNLNLVSYGTLDDLQSMSGKVESVFKVAELIAGISNKELLDADVNDVFGFFNMVRKEVEKINKLFASIKSTYSEDEVSAGVNDLQFGSFGVLDWYAKRMHIADHNEVREIAWVRIYNCMKNDNEVSEYERRLYKIQENRIKRK